MVWGLWSVVMAVVIWAIRSRFSTLESIAVGWIAVFVLMWLSIGNLGVLPFGLLPVAVPWSLVEVAGTVLVMGLGTRARGV
jgi:hypothetical protein